MSDIPETQPPGIEVEKVFERLPVTLNLGEPGTIVGWANAWRGGEDNGVTLVIHLDGEGSEKMGDLTKFFELYSIGFAGVARPHVP